MRLSRYYCLIAGSALWVTIALSQSPVDSLMNLETRFTDSLSVDYGRLAIVGGIMAGSMTAIHFIQQNGWWKDNRTSFHVREDLSYGANVDKIGHFYGSTILTFGISKSLEWAHVPQEQALWYGAGGALLFQTYIEVEDGFSTWGFDRVDFAADVAGAAWPLIQHHLPFTRNVNVKMSYVPSDLIGTNRGIGFQGQHHIFIDDYEGQTFWLSGNMNNLLPESAERYWPDFLCLAVGYGARDIGIKDVSSYRAYFISLDYDMTKIIPQNTWFLRTLSEALNFIHLPAPAVRISPSTIWYGLYF